MLCHEAAPAPWEGGSGDQVLGLVLAKESVWTGLPGVPKYPPIITIIWLDQLHPTTNMFERDRVALQKRVAATPVKLLAIRQQHSWGSWTAWTRPSVRPSWHCSLVQCTWARPRRLEMLRRLWCSTYTIPFLKCCPKDTSACSARGSFFNFYLRCPGVIFFGIDHAIHACFVANQVQTLSSLSASMTESLETHVAQNLQSTQLCWSFWTSCRHSAVNN